METDTAIEGHHAPTGLAGQIHQPGIVDLLMTQGARGIVYGRNVIQHPNPGGMTRALMAVVHDRISPEAALKHLI